MTPLGMVSAFASRRIGGIGGGGVASRALALAFTLLLGLLGGLLAVAFHAFELVVWLPRHGLPPSGDKRQVERARARRGTARPTFRGWGRPASRASADLRPTAVGRPTSCRCAGR